MLRLLGISGSLRRGSSNTALLQAAALLVPEGIELVLYEGLGDLPHFNPDLDEAQPEAVRDWRAQVDAADGLLVSTPEYAHGVPGVLKNALDWLVGSTELSDKPVALFNASTRSTYAVASLTETLTIMGARVLPDAALTVALLGRKLDGAGIAAHGEYAEQIRQGIVTFARAIEAGRANSR